MIYYANDGKSPPWGSYPCVACRGKGWDYDPDDPPDPVEGYKLVRRLKCSKCKGQKYSTSAEDKAGFENFIEESRRNYEAKVKEYENHTKTVAEALSKLNEVEINALKKEWTKRNFQL